MQETSLQLMHECNVHSNTQLHTEKLNALLVTILHSSMNSASMLLAK